MSTQTQYTADDTRAALQAQSALADRRAGIDPYAELDAIEFEQFPARTACERMDARRRAETRGVAVLRDARLWESERFPAGAAPTPTPPVGLQGAIVVEAGHLGAGVMVRLVGLLPREA